MFVYVFPVNTASPNRNKNKMKGLFDKGLFDNTLPCLETACNRAPPEAIVQESKLVLGHQVSHRD